MKLVKNENTKNKEYKADKNLWKCSRLHTTTTNRERRHVPMLLISEFIWKVLQKKRRIEFSFFFLICCRSLQIWGSKKKFRIMLYQKGQLLKQFITSSCQKMRSLFTQFLNDLPSMTIMARFVLDFQPRIRRRSIEKWKTNTKQIIEKTKTEKHNFSHKPTKLYVSAIKDK